MIQYIEKVLTDFHACTDMYIGLFDYSDNCLLLYPDACTLPFDSADTYKAVRHTLSLLYVQKDAPYVTSSYKSSDLFIKNVCFTACYLNPVLGIDGVYVFGPYSIKKETEYNLPYVPKVGEKHLVELLHSITTEHFADKSASLAYQNYHINRIISYVESHYQDSLSLKRIASHLHMDMCYLCRLFKSETGQTFTEFLNNYRVEMSKNLLRHGTRSFLEISQSVGFSSQSYYCRIFKKLSGITPKEYRNSFHQLPQNGRHNTS